MFTKKLFPVIAAISILALIIVSCSFSQPGGKNNQPKPDVLDKNAGSAAGSSSTAAPAPPDLPYWTMVQAGEFDMGSSPEDPNASPDEFPKHAVRLPTFWILTTEVTNGQYAACVAEGKCTPPVKTDSGPGSHYGDPAFINFPVSGVNWDQADAYCRSIQASLPSEAQWEKAARGFFGNLYPWGDDKPACNLANLSGCLQDAALAGIYKDGASPFGVMEMAGNLREWVADWYEPKGYEAFRLFMPGGPESGIQRVVRGGSFMDSARDIRSSARFSADPARDFADVGFRCVDSTRTTFPFCSTSYRPYCSPPSDGDTPDQPCEPGPQVQYENPGKVSISCPENGVGTVQVGLSYEVVNIEVTVNGVVLSCTPASGTAFTCTGPIPDTGAEASIEVCSKSVPQATINGYYGIQLASCDTYALPIPNGNASASSPGVHQFNFLPGMPGVPRSLPQPNGDVCPAGYTWDIASKNCVRDTVPTDDPQYAGYCIPGYIFDPLLQCCVPGETVNCEPNMYMAAQTEPCVEIPPNGCPQGFTYDPYLGCIQGSGQQPGGGFTCPPGQYYAPGYGCVPQGPSQCKDGEYYDHNSAECRPLNPDGCQPGTYMDPQYKQCMPLMGPWTGCPKGYMINPKTGCCVPIPGTDNTDCPGYPDGQSGEPQQLILVGTDGYDPVQGICDPPPEVQCPPNMHPNPNGSLDCILNYDCPPGTGPNPNNPDGCFPQGTEPCPQGYEMSNSGLGCVPIMQDGIQVQCDLTQYYDPILGMCLDLTDDCCAQGYYYDTKLKLCLPYPEDSQCPPGYYFSQDQQCLPYAQSINFCQSFSLTVPGCQTECPPGTIWAANQQACVKDDPCAQFNCSKYDNDPKACDTHECCQFVRNPTGGGNCVSQ